LNYRHAFHAGNFADVVKHAILVRILIHLSAKITPFRIIDIHAGAGLYDLAGEQASRSGEWREGIGRLRGAPSSSLLTPYVNAVTAVNAASELTAYPGSPVLARGFLRGADRLIACELEPTAAAELTRNLAGDRRCKAVAIDCWTALNAYIPPTERRGVVLIDPSFEDTQEFPRAGKALAAAYRKWPTGIYLLWYPLKERRPADALAQHLHRAGIGKMLRAEVNLPPRNSDRLSACGLIIVNPPWLLESELRQLMPELVAALGPGGTHRVDWLARAK